MNYSLVIPVYNGSATIEKLVERLLSTLTTKEIQIVLVNDGSQDNSDQVCFGLREKFPDVITYINLSKNFGEHNAVMAGLNFATGDYTVILDDDFQNPPEEVIKLIKCAEENNHDIVYAYYNQKQHHWLRNIGSVFTNFIAGYLLDKPKGLYLSSFKCLSRFSVDEIIKYRGPFPYIDGLALRCTRKIGVVEVAHDKRLTGRSGYTFRKLVHLWLNMFVNFSIMPLRISSMLGMLFSLLGMLLSVLVVIDKMIEPEMPLGFPSLIIATLIFAGVQLFMLGVLGEYMGRMFLSSNQTPQFIIRQIYQGEKTCEHD